MSKTPDNRIYAAKQDGKSLLDIFHEHHTERSKAAGCLNPQTAGADIRKKEYIHADNAKKPNGADSVKKPDEVKFDFYIAAVQSKTYPDAGEVNYTCFNTLEDAKKNAFWFGREQAVFGAVRLKK
jgi:hypothetical protein